MDLDELSSLATFAYWDLNANQDHKVINALYDAAPARLQRSAWQIMLEMNQERHHPEESFIGLFWMMFVELWVVAPVKVRADILMEYHKQEFRRRELVAA